MSGSQHPDNKKVCAVVGIGPKNGAAFARRFAREGYRVAMLSRRTDLSEQLAAELGDARAYACDVTSPDAVQTAFTRVVKDLGEIDVLVYNAGSGVWGNVEELRPEDFEMSWKTNAFGLFLCAQQVIEPMKQREGGAIIVIGATASLRGKPFTTAFAPAKAAQRSLAQAMARHLGPMGIHVSLMIVDGMIDNGASDNPTPSKLDPNDIATTALFLAQQPRSAWSFEVDVRPSQENW